MGLGYKWRRIKRRVKYYLNYYEIIRFYPVCDVCGSPSTHVVRNGGLASDGNSVNGPNLWGCGKHLQGSMLWD